MEGWKEAKTEIGKERRKREMKGNNKEKSQGGKERKMD